MEEDIIRPLIRSSVDPTDFRMLRRQPTPRPHEEVDGQSWVNVWFRGGFDRRWVPSVGRLIRPRYRSLPAFGLAGVFFVLGSFGPWLTGAVEIPTCHTGAHFQAQPPEK